ncbi:amidase [Diaporthe helianthi]|uniref:Amidase n=1 Tax=Diaporthe helianthi TaxID=158607 RepID=A0A2P5HH87_DIAHE|nr:amidase [Diaporthe helianthi]
MSAGLAGEKYAVSREAFRGLATSLGFQVQPQDEAGYLDLLRAAIADIEMVQAMPPYQHPILRTTHGAGERTSIQPLPSENPLNGWSHRKFTQTTIRPLAEGLLSGKTIAVKDNVSIAGVPMTGGTAPFHLSKDTPYPISGFDAPVITRVLEAGGTITGTSTCENYCMSALSFSSATGPVDNPWLKGYETGGSSSGSAALVGVNSVKRQRQRDGMPYEDLGEGVDLAIGGDQGGSIRMPAAYSGIYGLKPTHGLVPYTGISPLHPMIDHCGPMAGSIRDTALLLTVLAGWDGLDPRMTPETPLRQHVKSYHEHLDEAIEQRKASGQWNPTSAATGLRIGLVKEGWAAPQLSEEVAAVVKQAGQRFAALGAKVDEVSIPMHAMGSAIFTAVEKPEWVDVFIYGKAPDCLSWPMQHVAPTKPDAQWYETMNKSAPTVVSTLVTGEFLKRNKDIFATGAREKAITHVHELRAAYDEALVDFDVLITPCNPTVGMRHLGPELSVVEKNELALGSTWNTCPFNITGHPGLVIPVGWGKTEDGQGRLPVGMQMVGRRWDEVTLFLAAEAWEVGGLGLDG